MPELPEVETISSDLNKNLSGEKFLSIKILDKKILFSKANLKNVLKHKIINIRRIAKTIVISLDNDFNIVFHLKMTGQLVLKTKQSIFAGGHPIKKISSLPNKFTRLILTLTSDKELYFNDVRRFGWARILSNLEIEKNKSNLGLEPFSKEFNLASLKKFFSKTKRKIKTVLLDQKAIVGIGNIYADESLFKAGIRPDREASSLSDAEIRKLKEAIIAILKKSIKYRGTSFSDYVDGLGKNGEFVKYLEVYGRGSKPCLNCSRKLKKIKLAGRGTVCCEFCQK